MPLTEINPRESSDAGPTTDFVSRGAALVEELLAAQQDLSAVERFVQIHEADGAAARAKLYRSLLPSAPPAPGQQYAFEVDLDRCSGCKACVTACHTLNGLDAGETWRDVGLLIGGSRSLPVLQHVTTACHHCLEPACQKACPVNAYEKDAATGIVRHLDDQCFGCQYCTLACPYDVPKYHRGKGIVRKCDMCSSRLAVGEAPACVQACPHQAIAITLVDVQQVVEDSEATLFLPGAPDPQITLPATVYKTRRAFPRNLLAADYFDPRPQHPHWPLVLMLVLTQLSAGAFAAGLALELWGDAATAAAVRPLNAATALAFGLLALGASILHLGRPQYAFRAVLGLRHSWLSREIVAFGAFAALACTYAAATLALDPRSELLTPLAGAVAVAGLAGVFCSVMIYALPQRELWDPARTSIRFLLTAVCLGIATLWLASLALAAASPSPATIGFAQQSGRPLCMALTAATAAKLVWEASLLRHLLSRNMTSLRRSALLVTGELANVAIARFALGVLGGIVMPAFQLSHLFTETSPWQPGRALIFGSVLFAACLVGELLERYLFFAAVAGPRMPGGMR
ncbi:MAG TPA: DmsC/YnfH family molybdoenzyme membrane anchor subunit [Pirellulales bacterium]|nr:DmsC/YnfH family molybdoenzyme membrane anchor subunit [Pirellulales bacterium]